MESREQDALVQRLVANPHDGEALTYAYQWGTSDPQAFALLLEKVGMATQDAVYASHWLSEAANVWLVSVGDAHRAARVLMTAIDRDPTQDTAAERLAALYRDRGEQRSLAALLERRARALARLTGVRPELRTTLAATYTELGQIWADALGQPRRAMDFFRQAVEAEPRAQYAIYALRELYKQAQAYPEAVALYEREHALVDDPARKLALFRDEAALRREAGDGAGATQVLRNARAFEPGDPTLLHEIASLVLERVQVGEPVPDEERQEAALMLVSLAEGYGGEHGYAYCAAALALEPGNDRAVQLLTFFGKGLGRVDELPAYWGAYLGANPEGLMAEEVRSELALMPTGPVPDLPPPRDEPAPSAPAPPSAEPGEPSGRSGERSGRPTPLAPPPQAPAPPPPVDVEALVRAGDEALARGGRAVAFGKYKEVLAARPAHPKALAAAREYLRPKRRYDELREVLSAAAAAAEAEEPERAKEILRELAALSEQQLRDVEGAIQALERLLALDRRDAAAGESLRRLLERAGRWDALADWLEGEIEAAAEPDAKLALLRRLAQLHEARRKDDVAAAGVWLRAASLGAGDAHALRTAMRLFERAGRLDAAVEALERAADQAPPGGGRAALFAQLAEARRKAGDPVGAAFALRAAAELTGETGGWEGAEQALAEAGRWLDAAETVEARARSARDDRAKAAFYLRAFRFYERAGEAELAGDRLGRAFELGPADEDIAEAYAGLLEREGRWAELAQALLAHAEHAPDPARRRDLGRRAARLQRDRLGDPEASRETLRRVLEGGDDEEALAALADDAEARGEHQEAAQLLRRIQRLPLLPAARLPVALREARLFAGPLADPAAALERYRLVARELDPHHAEALRFVADAEHAAGRFAEAAEALERLVGCVSGDERAQAARRLAALYEGPLADPSAALRALDAVGDPRRDPELLERVVGLCERVGDYARAAELLPRRIEMEGDPRAISALSRRLAQVLDAHLHAGDEALAALEGPADEGDEPCQKAYVELGDRLGWKGLVGVKLVAWHESRAHSPARTEALLGAFRRFSEMGRDAESLRVGLELMRSKAVDAAFVQRLEEFALRLRDQEAVVDVHEWLARGRSGAARADELVRQAEVRQKAGAEPATALAHAEPGLAGLPFDDAEPLLLRLAALAPPAEAPDVLERYAERAPKPKDRGRAFVRAARFAAERGLAPRAAALFERAVVSAGQGGLNDEALSALEEGARKGGRELVSALAQAFARAGHAFVDGGRARALLLRRAALLARSDLDDLEQAFHWLADAVVSHSEPSSLEALDALAQQTGDHALLDKAYGRALAGVVDGPAVRSLLHRRARVRRERLGDLPGALEDLKRLYELSPSDPAVVDSLKSLLAELGDERGTIRLLEDQIARSRDPALRAELAKTIARLCEERLDDPREAADAWRRVLRLQAGDPEAQEGLARAKAAMTQAGIEHEPSIPPPPPRTSSLPPASSPRTSSLPPSAPREPAARRPRSLAPPPLPASPSRPPSPSAPAAPARPPAPDPGAPVPPQTKTEPLRTPAAPPARDTGKFYELSTSTTDIEFLAPGEGEEEASDTIRATQLDVERAEAAIAAQDAPPVRAQTEVSPPRPRPFDVPNVSDDDDADGATRYDPSPAGAFAALAAAEPPKAAGPAQAPPKAAAPAPAAPKAAAPAQTAPKAAAPAPAAPKAAGPAPVAPKAAAAAPAAPKAADATPKPAPAATTNGGAQQHVDVVPDDLNEDSSSESGGEMFGDKTELTTTPFDPEWLKPRGG
ncbi:MAG TPA: hypothetical protein VFS43_30615 [Polyangiaceae bacterium]|nr:hypothetical protein [Polyangiaceae bacterium]